MTTGRPIDHLVIAARDLGALAARYEALGFTLTPRAYHEDRMGTSNRLAQFRGRNFIELLEVDRPETVEHPGPGGFAFGAFLKRYLADREGLAMVVFQSDDARADIERWHERNLDTYEPYDFERQATLPDGSTATVGFSLGFVTSPEMPELAFFVCQQHAPEHFWKPAFQDHANRAEEITAVTIAADHPERHADFLSRLFDGDVAVTGCGISVTCGPHRLDVCAPGKLSEPGVVSDSERGRAVGMSIRSPARAGTTTPAAEAGGVSIRWT